MIIIQQSIYAPLILQVYFIFTIIRHPLPSLLVFWGMASNQDSFDGSNAS
jgi:hypothetical protein